MSIPKYKYAAAVALLTALSNSPVAIGQTLSCFPLPPGMTSLPAGYTLPPGVVLCPLEPMLTTVAPDPVVTTAPTPVPAPVIAAPAPAPVVIDPVVTTAPTPVPAPVIAAPQATTTISGLVDEDHEGRGKKNGMDNGKKKGLFKDHDSNADNGGKLVMTGTISGNTLTVTAITSGHLEIGTKLSGGGIAQPVKIVAFGTGKGGVGTYTIALDK